MVVVIIIIMHRFFYNMLYNIGLIEVLNIY